MGNNLIHNRTFYLDSAGALSDKNMERAVAKHRAWQRKALIFTFILFVIFVIVFAILLCYVTGVIKGECPEKDESGSSSIEKVPFGEFEGKAVSKYVLRNKKTMMEAQVMDLGGTLISLKVPVKDQLHTTRDVVLGYDNLKGYEADTSTYFGALIGRYANRIANGTFSINGQLYNVSVNDHGNSLHGGKKGWNRMLWQSSIRDDYLVLSYWSPNKDEGYPGTVHTQVTYRLVDDRSLEINFTAEVMQSATPISLTAHPYFNLNGEGSGDIKGHKIVVYADYYLPVDNQLIPTGEIRSVEGTVFDLRYQRKLQDQFSNPELDGIGYDHNLCIRGASGKKLMARVWSGDSAPGVTMEVYSNQPGLQFYTGNFLNVTHGKNGHSYQKHSAFCLEPQNYPDAPNHKNFPDSILWPGSEYVHTMWYKFPDY